MGRAPAGLGRQPTCSPRWPRLIFHQMGARQPPFSHFVPPAPLLAHMTQGTPRSEKPWLLGAPLTQDVRPAHLDGPVMFQTAAAAPSQRQGWPMEALPRLIGPAHVPFGGRSAVARTKWRMNRCLERPAIQPTTRSVTLDASLWGDTRCVNPDARLQGASPRGHLGVGAARGAR